MCLGLMMAMGPILAPHVVLGSGDGVIEGEGGQWWAMGLIPAPQHWVGERVGGVWADGG